MASCCYGKQFSGSGAGVNPSRGAVNGIHGYISHYGDDTAATTAPAWGSGVAGFGKMVGAGVTIWAITRVLDRAFSRRSR